MLVKQITEIKVALAPFNKASKASRLFLNRVNTDETRKINPAIKISTQFLQDAKAPSRIDVVYRDGKKMGLETDKMNIDSLMELVNKHAKKLDEVEQANSW
ncbi:hypothetical protein RO3G_02175 [Lichtheimia corymbifera JMRC:FSU:9682]|uniref:Large ribosomal subunit protein mL53 n=2 Tax=Lichtheimia TaxID=688353 RepID=A0A068RSQ6_9FUNG|nr:uncharacterized protein O0I10_000656 [Lichtheimia ornata]KAJ8663417.1 hypothetical protein O0I10_000656 [Lichtheimia ornata]CDH52755.1 hypothetical protein RO3G_02175 [Lichtheimia corymbifera JMRC:FSU:9682]